MSKKLYFLARRRREFEIEKVSFRHPIGLLFTSNRLFVEPSHPPNEQRWKEKFKWKQYEYQEVFYVKQKSRFLHTFFCDVNDLKAIHFIYIPFHSLIPNSSRMTAGCFAFGLCRTRFHIFFYCPFYVLIESDNRLLRDKLPQCSIERQNPHVFMTVRMLWRLIYCNRFLRFANIANILSSHNQTLHGANFHAFFWWIMKKFIIDGYKQKGQGVCMITSSFVCFEMLVWVVLLSFFQGVVWKWCQGRDAKCA